MTITTTTGTTEVAPSSVAEVLSRAKHLLETDGWTTGVFKCETGAQCAAGAVYAACGLPYDETRYNVGEATEEVEYDVRVARLDDPKYVEAIRVLAEAMNPKLLAEHAKWTGSISAHVYEGTVTGFNDERVNTKVGRNVVLRRFDKAIAALTK